MASAIVLLPGDEVSSDQVPRSKKGTLALGPGLYHTPPSTLSATTAGTLLTDQRKAALWLEHSNGRYQPSVGDLVVAQIHHSAAEVYHCTVVPHMPTALLGQLAFEGANKKTRPQLKAGDLVYARVCKAGGGEDVEIECFNSATGKAEGMGPLKAGMAFNISPGFARRLMMGKAKGGVCVLEEVGEKVRFEVAVGRNGRVWVDSGSVKGTVMIGRLLTRADEEKWDLERQKKEVKKALKDV